MGKELRISIGLSVDPVRTLSPANCTTTRSVSLNLLALHLARPQFLPRRQGSWTDFGRTKVSQRL
jgi:hypothetical protein